MNRLKFPLLPPGLDVRRLAAALTRQRRGIVAAALLALAGFGITALAIAPLTVEPAIPAQRLLVETLEPVDLQPQLQALAAQDLQLTRSTLTRSTDSVESLLLRLGVSDAATAAQLRGDRSVGRALAGRGGKMAQARSDAEGRLTQFVLRFPAERSEQRLTHFSRLTLAQRDGQWHTSLEQAELVPQARLASGTIRSSLFAATDEAGLSDAVAAQLAEVFAADIDFHRELRKGDTFHLVYEALSADGEPISWSDGTGRVLAAEFANAGRTHHAIWFIGPDGRGEYYGADGRSRRRVFLASPMEFSRVTSGFAMRLHPLLQTRRAHLGVDYSAPKGTPVRVVGDGQVEFAAWQGGFGNLVRVRHDNAHTTLYAHLSRIDVKPGQRVLQGQHIGAVGATGWATGPHLHFEFRVNGAHQNPLRVARAAEAVPLDPAARQAFAAHARVAQERLELAQTLSGPQVKVE